MSSDLVSLCRARLAGETGAVRKEWGGRCPVALVYPNHYRLGMSNLGFQIVYRIINDRDDCLAERFFLPDGQEMPLYRQTGRPLLSLESQRPLFEFRLIAFSVSFENDYPHILKILEMGRLPCLSQDRSRDHPPVLAGGVATFLNTEPLAPFMDLFLLGEAEPSLNAFLDDYVQLVKGLARKEDLLRELAGNHPSVYVPSFYNVTYREDGAIASFLPRESAFPEKIKVARAPQAALGRSVSSLKTRESEFSDTVLVELGRGCGRSCRFCAAGFVYRPPRMPPLEDLRRAVDRASQEKGRVGLIGAAISDVPEIESLTALILERGCLFSVSSLRADALTEGLLAHLRESGQKTLTIAPEAGSERLRRVINKHLTDDQIMEAAARIAKAGPFNLRLYFLTGLPTETREDVREILNLVKGIKHHMVKASAARGAIGQIRVSVSCFVPKPFTPFQWFPLEQASSLREKQKWLQGVFSREGGVKVSFDVPKWAYVQALLALGDRRVGNMLWQVHRSEGNWTKGLRSSEVNPDFFVYRPRALDEILPWDFIDHGIEKAHLLQEREMALDAAETDTCQPGDCLRCGACGGRTWGDLLDG